MEICCFLETGIGKRLFKPETLVARVSATVPFPYQFMHDSVPKPDRKSILHAGSACQQCAGQLQAVDHGRDIYLGTRAEMENGSENCVLVQAQVTKRSRSMENVVAERGRDTRERKK